MPDWIRLVRLFPQTREIVKSMEGKTYCLYIFTPVHVVISQRTLVWSWKESFSMFTCKLKLNFSEVSVLPFIISWCQQHDGLILNLSRTNRIQEFNWRFEDLASAVIINFFLNCQNITGPKYFLRNIHCMSVLISSIFSLNHNSFNWCEGNKMIMKFSGTFFLISKWFFPESFSFLCNNLDYELEISV